MIPSCMGDGDGSFSSKSHLWMHHETWSVQNQTSKLDFHLRAYVTSDVHWVECLLAPRDADPTSFDLRSVRWLELRLCTVIAPNYRGSFNFHVRKDYSSSYSTELRHLHSIVIRAHSKNLHTVPSPIFWKMRRAMTENTVTQNMK